MNFFQDAFMNALETTDEDRANILYMGYLLTKSNRDTPQKTKRIQVKILRSPMSYNNLFQALMFSYHPSYVTDMLRTEVGFELHVLYAWIQSIRSRMRRSIWTLIASKIGQRKKWFFKMSEARRICFGIPFRRVLLEWKIYWTCPRWN